MCEDKGVAPAPQDPVNSVESPPDVRDVLPGGFVIEWQNGLDYAAHHCGIPWHKAAPPPSGHKCGVQTVGLFNGNYVERCACGRFGPSPFLLIGNDKPREQERPSLVKRVLAALR